MSTSNQNLAAFCAWALVCGLSSAHAAAPAADPVPSLSARNVACLQAAAPKTLALSKSVEGTARLLRARLSFRPDAPEPRVEWLWSGDAEAAKQLEPSLRAYRMPCLAGQQGEQAVVQEFWLEPGTGRLESGEAWPANGQDRAAKSSCDVVQDMSARLWKNTDSAPSAGMVFFRFLQGQDVPEVKVAHAVGPRSFPAALHRAAQALRPCADDPAPEDWHVVSVSRGMGGDALQQPKPLELTALLGMTKAPESLRGHFDTNTMSCPFQLQFWVGQPALPNQASSIGSPNAHRTAFLGWLGSLKLDLPPDADERRVAAPLTVNVPCTVLDLKGGT
ncbi:MAG: hypothetical protein DI603_09965 [Roseateles depolymerans]|uniref:Uncharacterized protein n=1 Tax=Roseateles depolymerans TaxID=76731 RepID=A0A2W5DKE8_9BURK|nr:MAG: hypothetical protein DI603_09965 [Roseateles depolymerans]